MEPTAPAKTVFEGSFRKLAFIIPFILLASVFPRVYGLFLKSSPVRNSLAAPAAILRTPDFATDLRLSGTTQAARSFMVLAPQLEGAQLGTMAITSLVPAGAHVEPGD